MAKIISTDGASPAELPAVGTHAVYTKTDPPGVSGLYVMDSTGTEVGPLSVGGGPPSGPANPPGVLTGTYPDNIGLAAGAVGTTNLAPFAVTNAKIGANAVTGDKIGPTEVDTGNIKDLAIQTIKLANDAVTSAKIANGNVTSGKLAMSPVPYGFILSDSVGGPWTGGLPSQIKFASPSRIAILGDPGGATDPFFPRLLKSIGPVDLGYLSKTLPYEIKFGPVDLASRPDEPTVFNATLSTPQTTTLPDSRKYPSGTEITFVHIGGGDPTNVLTILKTGTVGGGYADIKGSAPFVPAEDQTLIPGQTKRFATFGNGWFVSRESFRRQKVIPLADGVAGANFGTGATEWAFNPPLGRWDSIIPQRLVSFPVVLPDGAILTNVDVILAMSGLLPATRMKVHLYREDLDFATPGTVVSLVALVTAAASLLQQTVSLTSLAEFIDMTQHHWTVVVESSTNVIPNIDVVYGVRLTYTP